MTDLIQLIQNYKHLRENERINFASLSEKLREFASMLDNSRDNSRCVQLLRVVIKIIFCTKYIDFAFESTFFIWQSTYLLNIFPK